MTWNADPPDRSNDYVSSPAAVRWPGAALHRVAWSLACLKRSAYPAGQDLSMLGIDHPGWPGNRRSRVAEILFGRSTELALIDAFVERAGTGGEPLLLVGEAGAGKTALLDVAAVAAEEAGTWVLRAAGVEFEADLTYS